MAIHLLLDTNILLQLVSPEIFSPYLSKLEYWVKHNHVVLLAPKELKAEWMKHRNDAYKKVENSFQNLQESARTSRIFEDQSFAYYESKLNEKKQELDSQIKTINELLEDCAIHVDSTAETIIRVHKQRELKKKPFWNNKKDHTNDAILIFSSLNFLKSKFVNVFYFVSANTNEFAIDQKGNLSLHPDIAEIEPDIRIHYYTHFKDLVEELEKLNIPLPEDSRWNKSRNKPYTFHIDSNLPILDQIAQYFDKRFSDINIIPPQLFLNHYPFILNVKSTFYRRPFCLSTDNESVFNLLTRVKIIDGVLIEGQEYIKNNEDENKFKTILKTLRFNSVFRVALGDGDAVSFTYTEKNNSCSCPICLYHKMNWQALINKKFEPNGDYHQSKLMHAYGQFLSGNSLAAIQTLEELKEEMGIKRDIAYYIICFNLQKLGYNLRNNYYDDSEILKKAKSLISLDLDEIYKECNSPKNETLLSYIHDKEFLSTITTEINAKVNEITDLFHGRNTGHNNHVEKLIETYYSFLTFLERNYIIYPFFEVDAITNLFTHGLFASYGSNNLLSGKLRSLSNDLIKNLILYGDAELMQKLYYRYNLGDVKYEDHESTQFSIDECLKTLISNYPAVKETIRSHGAINERFFWENHNNIFYNSLVLLSILNIEVKKLHEISSLIITYVNTASHLREFDLAKYLVFFLTKKNRLLPEHLLRDFLIFVIKNSSHNTDDYLQAFQEAFQNKKTKVFLTPEEFDYVKKGYLISNEKDRLNRTWHSLGYLFLFLGNNQQKEEIRAYATGLLNTAFKTNNFYIAIMFEIITDYHPFLEIYNDLIENLVKAGRQPRLFERKEYYTDREVDHYLNFCFKYNIEIPVEIARMIASLGDYYTWLLNLDEFDYTNFNKDWVHHHFTLYYKIRFKKSKILKGHLFKIIQEDANSDLERMFIFTYHQE